MIFVQGGETEVIGVDILGQSNDRRITARIDVLKSGTVVSIDGLHREACVVDNFSETGALLIVKEPQKLQANLLLIIDGEKHRRPARVIRRTRNTIAVWFVTKEMAKTAGDAWVFPPDAF